MNSAAAQIEVDLGALRHNVIRVREFSPQSKILAVIKANAYGHDLVIIANCLAHYVDGFAVARIGEAIRLRKARITQKIVVLQGARTENELTLFDRYQLDMVVHSEAQVAMLESANLHKSCRIWLKIDTGMHRLGIEPEQFAPLLSRLEQSREVQEPIRFMTHFASADDLQDEKTTQQLKIFKATIKSYSGEKSSANSAALIAWPETQMDWVRPGLMLYGVSPLLAKTAQQLDLRPVMSLYAYLIAVKQVKKGETVGYGGSWVASKDSLIGVVSAGYGDGYPRYARQGTPVLINKQRMPLIGRVSMDMLTVDLTGSVGVKSGDKVLLWGEGLAVEDIAACAETIPYTLLCGITPRVEIVVKA